MSWLVIDMTTGRMDGVYHDRDMARGSFQRRCEEEPRRACWVLVSVEDSQREAYGIADPLWWATHPATNQLVAESAA